MTYLQVKDVLEQAKQVRQFVCNYAKRHQQKAGDDLLEGLFRVIQEHEQRLEDVLAGVQDKAAAELQESWIQYPGVDQLEKAMDELSAVDEQNHDVVLQHLLETEQSLAEMYDQVKREQHALRVQELFEELQQLQESHIREIAKCVTEYDQMGGQ